MIDWDTILAYGVGWFFGVAAANLIIIVITVILDRRSK